MREVRTLDGDGLRAHKKAKTRHALADAALLLFAERGFEATTVEEIAGRCEVSPRTFFRYFGSKEDALWAESEDYRALLVEQLHARPDRERPLRALRGALLALAAAYEGQADRVAKRNDVLAATPRLRIRAMEQQSDWEDAIAQALEEHPAAAGCTPFHLKLVAATGMAALRVSVDEWAGDGNRSLPAIIEDVFDDLAHGLDRKRGPAHP